MGRKDCGWRLQRACPTSTPARQAPTCQLKPAAVRQGSSPASQSHTRYCFIRRCTHDSFSTCAGLGTQYPIHFCSPHRACWSAHPRCSCFRERRAVSAASKQVPGSLASLVLVYVLCPHFWLRKVHYGATRRPGPLLLCLTAPAACATLSWLLALLDSCDTAAALADICLLLSMLVWRRSGSCSNSGASQLGRLPGRGRGLRCLLLLQPLLGWLGPLLCMRFRLLNYFNGNCFLQVLLRQTLVGKPCGLLGRRCLLFCSWRFELLRALAAAAAAASAPCCRLCGRACCAPTPDCCCVRFACHPLAAGRVCWLGDLAGPWVVPWKPGGLAPTDQRPQRLPFQILPITILIQDKPAAV